MNSVILIGRLTANPTSHAGEQHESATFRLAVPRPSSDAVDFLGAPKAKPADEPEVPADKAAVGAYRRKAS